MPNIEPARTGQPERCQHRNQQAAQIDLAGSRCAIDAAISRKTVRACCKRHQADEGVRGPQGGNRMWHGDVSEVNNRLVGR
ncbi:hypothetical protein D3C78_1622450 [compost metagenome]